MTTPFIKVIKNELVTGVSISLISVVVGPSLQLGLMSGEAVTQLGWFGYDGPQINSHQVIMLKCQTLDGHSYNTSRVLSCC